MRILIIAIVYLLLWNITPAQPIPADSLYLGQVPPGNTPKIFVLPVNGTMRPVERLTITSDGKELYFGEIDTYPANIQRVKCYKYLENRWQGPFVVFEGYMSPALSVNDSIIYIERDVNTFATSYYSVRNGTGWNEPLRQLSTTQQTHYFQGTNQGHFYLSATFPGSSPKDLAYLQINGVDTTIRNLGKPINSNIDQNDFFIQRDESYIIFARNSSSLYSDLFISYKKADGTWTNPKSLGPQINPPGATWEFGCYVTDDNRYLFFTRGGTAWSSYYVYWVRIDDVIDSLKYTNYIPYLRNQIPNQTDTAGKQYLYTFPDSTFVDDDGNNTLSYTAALSNGQPLPSWLSFDPAKRTFSGLISSVSSLSIKVTAIDTASASAYCTFSLNIVQQIGLNPISEIVPDEYRLLQNYPNPFNPNTSISFDIPKQSQVNLRVFDAAGREAAVLVNETLRAGSYEVSLNAVNLSSGIYFYRLESGSFVQTRKMILLK